MTVIRSPMLLMEATTWEQRKP